METKQRKRINLKEFKQSLDAYIKGYFGEDSDADAIEVQYYVKEEFAILYKMAKENWEGARMHAVAEILNIEDTERRDLLLYGRDALCNKKKQALKLILEYVCNTLPPIEEGE